jgi:hypothetical protein
LPVDGATDLPNNLEVAFARWPAAECDFEVRLFVEGQAEPISVNKYWFERRNGEYPWTWKAVGLGPDAQAGQHFRIEVHPEVGESPGFSPYVARFHLGEREMDPPNPGAADLSGSGFVQVGDRSTGRFALQAAWPEVGGTPYGYVHLRGVANDDYAADPPILLPDENGNFSYETGIRLPAFRETCASATLASGLTPPGSDVPASTNHRFCLRRSGCAAAPGDGLVPILVALLALLARRSRGAP